MDPQELKRFIIDVIDEAFGPKPVEIGARWAEGTMILKPTGDNQPKEIPLEVFWKKLTGLRESLRVLEQKVNGHPQLGAEDRATLQGYITKCYGSLTTFNILFKNDKDKFVGSGDGPKGSAAPVGSGGDKLTVGEARKRMGIKEYGDG